ncbi:MAG: squalene--hopene cyclase [Solirubrobacterales bacterium]
MPTGGEYITQSDRRADLDLVEEATRKTCEHLLGLQNEEGYWVGELEADASVAAGYIPLMLFVTGKFDDVRARKIVHYVMSRQQPDGSWSLYEGGPGDLSASIQVYFALKVAGKAETEPEMRRAREFILSKGGVQRANVITKIWLSLFGQYEWRHIPSLPPELILLPDWFHFNIYELSSWSRATAVALMLVVTLRPVCAVAESARVDELYDERQPRGVRARPRCPPARKLFFRSVDRIFKIAERLPYKPFRKRALRKVEQWLIEHQDADGSWAGIMLPWIYALIGLKALGLSSSHPVIAKGLRGLERFLVEDEESVWLQPAMSPVWDTAWATVTLADCGVAPDHPALARAARWMLREQVRVPGDWVVKTPDVVPGGWAFEFDNDHYPDIDDTALAARALLQVRLPESEEQAKREAIDRGLRWILAMQNDNGGWAAFDRENNLKLLTHIPFADFITPLDPDSPDIVAHVLELFGEIGYGGEELDRALRYLQAQQKPDGAWYGRWGVNYIYGTSLVLAADSLLMRRLPESCVHRAAAWLKSHQNADGSWGETCQSYEDPACRGIGPGTASQTGWALLGLIGAGEARSETVRKGIRYLVQTQNADGTWTETACTGTGFPCTFYLRYDLYRLYFPLLALSRYSRAIAAMETPENPEQLVAQVPPGERILLLPHCLRRSAVCAAKSSDQGLQCASCTPTCPINLLRHKALELGYREVCVASGGRMALKHVVDSKPAAVVAVACAKELTEGIEGVKVMMSGEYPPPPIAIIPLTKDQCVDTEVNIEQALRVIAAGCEPSHSVSVREAVLSPTSRFFRTVRDLARSGLPSPGIKSLCIRDDGHPSQEPGIHCIEERPTVVASVDGSRASGRPDESPVAGHAGATRSGNPSD